MLLPPPARRAIHRGTTAAATLEKFNYLCQVRQSCSSVAGIRGRASITCTAKGCFTGLREKGTAASSPCLSQGRSRTKCFDGRRRWASTEVVLREGGEVGGASPAISNEVTFDDVSTEVSVVDSEEADASAATSFVSSETAESGDVSSAIFASSGEAAEFDHVPTTTPEVSSEAAEFDSVSTTSPTIRSEEAEFDSVSTASPTISSEAADLDHVPSETPPARSQGPRLRVNDGWALLEFETMRQRVENLIDYKFQDLDYLRLALYPGDSRIDDHKFPKTKSQLASVGDAVHKLIYVADHFPWSSSATMENYKVLASNVHIARIAKRHGLDAMRDSTLGLKARCTISAGSIWHDATLVEAIIGAVYLDSGRSDQTTRAVIDALGLGELTTMAQAHKELNSSPGTSVEVNSSGSIDKTRSMPENAPAPSHRSNRVERRANRMTILRKLLPDEPPGAGFAQLTRLLTARLKLAPPENSIYNHLDEIMQSVATVAPGDSGYEAVEELREQIREMQGTASTGDDIDTGSDDAGTTTEHEADLDNQVSLPFNSTSGNGYEPVLDATEANGLPTNETSLRLRSVQRRRKRQRRSLLRKHLPASNSYWTFSQLTTAFSARLAAASVDDAIYDDLDSVMAALRAFKPGDHGYEEVKELKERIRKLQNKERSASTQNSTDLAIGGETSLPQPSPSTEHDTSSSIAGIDEKLNGFGFASPQTLSLEVDHSLMSRFNSIRQRIEAITQYRFKDPDYLKAAIAPEVAYIGGTSLPKPRVELALIGDSIYKAVFFLDRFPSAGSMRRSHGAFERVSTNVHFCKRARRLNLNHLAGTMEGRLAANPTAGEIWREATLIEALIGAIYVDSGYSLSAVMRAIHAMDLSTPTGFGQGKISAATSQQRVWSMDALSNSLKAEVASVDSTNTESSTGAAHGSKNASGASNEQAVDEELARRRVLQKFLPPSARGFNLHDTLYWIKARVSEPEYRDTFFQHKDELESVLRSYGPDTRPYGLCQDILELLRLENLRRSTGTNDEDNRASANVPSDASSAAALDLEPLPGLETPANDNITKRPRSTSRDGIRQRLGRYRQSRLRTQVPGANKYTPISILLQKIQ